ncbi:secretory immunoglobulin A-binding protein EsiB [Opitutia bacterium]|nr:secretory immunoglobulin A-binding protein EsiB [Opitutae bacterium]
MVSQGRGSGVWPPAQTLLGHAYFNGEGVQQDQALAISWYRKAAEQGLAEAQYNLGGCYANGIGVAKDSCKR